MCGCASRARIWRSRVKRRRRLLSARPGTQQLQRDAALVQAVGARGQPDLAHAAFAEHALEPVRPDFGARAQARQRRDQRFGEEILVAFVQRDAASRSSSASAGSSSRSCAQAQFARRAASSSKSASSSGEMRCQRSGSIGTRPQGSTRGAQENPYESFNDASRNSRAFCQSRRMLRSERSSSAAISSSDRPAK